MKSLKYWLKSIAIDIAILAGLYAWKILGNENAGNAVMAVIWLFITIRVLGGLVLNKSYFEKTPRPTGFSTYNGTSEFLFFVIFGYFGLFATAAFSFLSYILMEHARKREPKIEA